LPPDVIFLKLKCIKFNFGRGSAPDPAAAAYTAPPDLLSGFKGTYFSGKEGQGRRKGRMKGPKRRGGEGGKGGKGKGSS